MNERFLKKLKAVNEQFYGIGIEDRSPVTALQIQRYIEAMRADNFKLAELFHFPTNLDIKEKETPDNPQ